MTTQKASTTRSETAAELERVANGMARLNPLAWLEPEIVVALVKLLRRATTQLRACKGERSTVDRNLLAALASARLSLKLNPNSRSARDMVRHYEAKIASVVMGDGDAGEPLDDLIEALKLSADGWKERADKAESQLASARSEALDHVLKYGIPGTCVASFELTEKVRGIARAEALKEAIVVCRKRAEGMSTSRKDEAHAIAEALTALLPSPPPAEGNAEIHINASPDLPPDADAALGCLSKEAYARVVDAPPPPMSKGENAPLTLDTVIEGIRKIRAMLPAPLLQVFDVINATESWQVSCLNCARLLDKCAELDPAVNPSVPPEDVVEAIRRWGEAQIATCEPDYVDDLGRKAKRTIVAWLRSSITKGKG